MNTHLDDTLILQKFTFNRIIHNFYENLQHILSKYIESISRCVTKFIMFLYSNLLDESN